MTYGPAPAAPAPVRPGPRALLRLAWPVVVSRSTQVVVGVFDALMVAGLGEAALAATTTGALNAMALFILPMGTVFIVSSFTSQLFGKGDLPSARRYGWYGLAVGLGTQLLLLGALPFLGIGLRLFSYDPEVLRLLDQYMFLRLLSGGAAVGVEALGNYYGGLGNTRLPMVANLGAMVVDVFGNYLFINGNLGAPALGVAGAAVTSTVSTWLACLFLVICFIRDGRGKPVPSKLRLRELRRMLRFGLPSGVNWFFEFLAFTLFINVVVVGLGTPSLAAMMTVMQINSVSFMPAFGLASAGAILVGQAIGAGDKDDVPRLVRITFYCCAVWQGVVGILYVGFPQLLFGAFVRGAQDPAALQDIGARMLALSAAWQLFDAAGGTLGEALRAAGDTTYVMWMRIIIAWVIFAPGAYLSTRYLGWGDRGAMLWLIVYLMLLALTLYLRFRNGAWRRIELTEPALIAD